MVRVRGATRRGEWGRREGGESSLGAEGGAGVREGVGGHGGS